MELLLLVALLFTPDVMAQAARSGVDAQQLVTYIWIAAWGMVGGLVSFYQKVRSGATRWLNINEVAGELLISGFVGIVTGLLCEAAGASTALTYGAVGITGHMGGRAIFWMEKALQRAAEKKLGIEKVEEKSKE